MNFKIGDKVKYKEDHRTTYVVTGVYPSSGDINILVIGDTRKAHEGYKYSEDWFYSITPLPLEELV